MNGQSTRADSAPEGAPDPAETGRLKLMLAGGRYAEAAALAQSMTARFPGSAVGWKALGVVFKLMGRHADALVPMQKAVELSPNEAAACFNLGVTQQDLGKADDALLSYRRALELQPEFAEAHCSVGNLLQDDRRFEDAIGSYRRALAIKADFAEAHYNLGVCLRAMGRFDAAAQSYHAALAIRPDFPDALNALALLFNERGQPKIALDFIGQSLRLHETSQAKRIFCSCIKSLRFTQADSWTRDAVARALDEPWAAPRDLMPVAANLIAISPVIGGLIAGATAAWPGCLPAETLFGPSGLAALDADPLLHAMLVSEPVCDMAMERFLTMARSALLDAATLSEGQPVESQLGTRFYAALARQCHINEYVYAHSAEELGKARHLSGLLAAALVSSGPVPVLWPLAVAAYLPLSSLSQSDRLRERQWPAHVDILLTQQLDEPAREQQSRSAMPLLTEIDQGVSLLVQAQYEENPYPRWIKAAPAEPASGVIDYLRRMFPRVDIRPSRQADGMDVLVAGCGTGQHAIDTARRFKNARVLAVDLSRSSLGYASRKTNELGLNSIEYAQADILKLGALGRSFDLIECVGVLHHLADPWAGWKSLLALLRPGGFMKLGFYSETARRNIVRIRGFIAERGYGSSAEDIRRARQDLVELDKHENFGIVLQTTDFFSMSACRDLLFHVQEHRVSLAELAAFLSENGLVLLGFDLGPEVLYAYKQRFPDDPACTNFDLWQIFENENPDVFLGMYQFWVQKH